MEVSRPNFHLFPTLFLNDFGRRASVFSSVLPPKELYARCGEFFLFREHGMRSFVRVHRLCTGMESRRDNGRMPMYSKRLLHWLELAEVALRPKRPQTINDQAFGAKPFQEAPVEHIVSEGEKVAQDEAEPSQKRI